MMTNILRPRLCPFCGSEVFLFEERGFYLLCPYCKIRTAVFPTEEALYTMWNTVFEEEPLLERVKKAEEKTLQYQLQSQEYKEWAKQAVKENERLCARIVELEKKISK